MVIIETDVANADTNEIVPQLQHMGPGYDWDAPDSVTKIVGNIPLERTPNFETFHLDPETRFTDVVSQSTIFTKGVLVSERLWKLLAGFSIQQHEAYEARVVHEGERRPYRWLHFTEEFETQVDYAASLFRIERIGGETEDVTVRNRHDLEELARMLVDSLSGNLVPVRIACLPGAPEYDFLCLQVLERRLYASAELAEALAGAAFTGLEVTSTSVPFSYPE